MMKHFNHPSFEYVNEGEEAIKVMVPTVKQVCPACNGFGTHERTDIDCSLLVDSMREDGDEDGLAGYFAGNYDVTCESCGGRNVVDEIDFDYFVANFPKYYEALVSWDEQERADAKYSAQERACGA